MTKNIIICSDGTGNADIRGRGTNVFKLFEAVDLHKHTGDPLLTPQIAFYDDGVGTESWTLLKLLGGAFGVGLARNVRSLYTQLARAYQPGDRIFLFGFSRGAFTVRSLAGLIAHIGIVNRECPSSDEDLKRRVQAAYDDFRNCFKRRSKLTHFRKNTRKFQEANSVCHPGRAKGDEFRVPIRFIGVWDTVDAVGFPIAGLATLWNAIFRYKFPDRSLSPTVERACHALALDDERHTFHPLPWNGHGEDTDRIEQVWFSGVHSNVGGGYPKQGLSLVTLAWMFDRAEQCGLRLLDSVRVLYDDLQNVNDKLYNSRAGLANYYRYKPRRMLVPCDICGHVHVPPVVHVRAIERTALGVDGYSPGILRPELSITGHPDPDVCKQLTEAIREHLENPDTQALQKQGRRWAVVKQATQMSFTAVSLLLVVSLFRFFHRQREWDATTILARNGWLLVLLIAIFAVTVRATSRIANAWSEFWFPLRPKLRQILGLQERVN